jgi:hypothetical protein
MSSASVRKISNGFIITSAGSAAIASQLYAATLAELPFWLGKVFDPVVTAQAQFAAPAMATPNDAGQVQINTFASGGFLVTYSAVGGKVETYCANMDAVSDTLAQVFTAPEPPQG